MIKKIKSKLAVKVFIISALLMAFCCGITYFFILHFAPYIYSYTPSDVEWFADELAQQLVLLLRDKVSRSGGILVVLPGQSYNISVM